MPYIKRSLRVGLSVGQLPRTAGELNYTIIQDLNQFIEREGLSYDTINTIVGVLECAKLELYRRVAVPYEQDKIIENGDVFGGITR